jgi:hypothetical protein
MRPLVIISNRSSADPNVDISEGYTYLRNSAPYMSVEERGAPYIPPVSNGVHPFMVPEMRENVSADNRGLSSQLVYPVVYFDGVVTTALAGSARNAVMHGTGLTYRSTMSPVCTK